MGGGAAPSSAQYEGVPREHLSAVGGSRDPVLGLIHILLSFLHSPNF